MDLKIFDSIIFGELRPFFGENKNEAYFTSKLNPQFTLPDNMEQFEDQLRIALKEHPLLLDSEEYLINLNPDEKVIDITSIRDDIFEPLIDIDTPPPFNFTTEFYFYLIKNDATRVRLKLIKEINVVNNQNDAVFIIKKLITQIEFLLSNLGKEIKALPKIQSQYRETPENETEPERIQKNTHYIFNFLLLTLVRLYFELDKLFSEIFKINFKSKDQLLSNVVGMSNNQYKLQELSKSFAILTVKKITEEKPFDVAKAFSIWTELNMYFQNDKSNQKLEQAIAAIENKLFMQPVWLESKDYSFTDLHSYKLFDEISSRVKESCKNAINKKDYGYERLEIVNGFIDPISKHFKGHNFESELIDNSIPRNIFKWLGIQTKLYSSELSKSFTQPVVITQEKEVQQDRKSESLFAPEKDDFRDIKKGVLKYEQIIKNPDRFARFEELLYENHYIGTNYVFKKKHGQINEMAMIYHYLINMSYFNERCLPTIRKITDLDIRNFLNYRYQADIIKQFNTFSNNTKEINTFVENNRWLEKLPHC